MSVTTQPEPMTRTEAIWTARRMREGGWTIPQIRDYLAARGQSRNRETIRRWSDPELMQRARDEAAARHRHKRAARAMRLTRPSQAYSPEFRFVRLLALREAGLSCPATAQVLRLDFGEPITAEQVRYAERVGRLSQRFGVVRVAA